MARIIYKFTILYNFKHREQNPFYVGQVVRDFSKEHFLRKDIYTYDGSGKTWMRFCKGLRRKFPTCWRKLIKREILFYSENCSQEVLDKMEEYFIKREKAHYSYGLGGCNILWGTANCFGAGSLMKDPNVADKVTKQLIGRKGAKRSEEGKLNMKIAAKKSWENAEERRMAVSKRVSAYMQNGGKEYLAKVKKGRKHTEEAKRKITLNHADFRGEKHPFYGKHFRWLTNGNINKILYDGAEMPEGFYYGRIQKKKYKMNIIFDGNFLFWRSFSIFSTYYKGQDMCEVLSDPEKQQVLIRKCVINFCSTLNKFKKVDKIIFVIDSRSWRYSLYDDYKYALTRVKEDYYKYFIEILNSFEKLLRKRGMIVSRVDGAEGDDLMYIWSLYLSYFNNEETIIITGDSDIRQLITDKVSLLNDNSKNFNFYCLNKSGNYWNDYFDNDVNIITVNPIEILLYKVVMGDTSDNIPKLKKGFGDKAFNKFLDSLDTKEISLSTELLDIANWITDRFCRFTREDDVEILGKVLFNLKMTWLNLSVYNSIDYITENGKSLLENMLDDLNEQKEKYSYNKSFTLEDFYGMLLK